MRASLRRRLSWRWRGLLTVGVAAVWLAGPLSLLVEAQAPVPVPVNAASFPQCMQEQLTASLSSVPSSEEQGGFLDPDTMLSGAWVCAGLYANQAILPIGQLMLGGLVLIMIIWTGIGFMFSGELDLGSLLGTLFLAGFGFIVLDNYFFASPAAVPWLPAGQTSNGFVALIADQAVVWSDLIMGTADTDFQRAYVDARDRGAEIRLGSDARLLTDPDNIYSEAVQSEDMEEAIEGLTRLEQFRARMSVVRAFHWLLSGALWLIGWMIYAQYLWGFFVLLVLTVVGPLFVPFMMVTQLDFLFWGWLKALLNGVIYMLTASALYAATAMLLIAPLQRLAEAPLPSDPGSFAAGMSLNLQLAIEFLPMVIMSLFAALKVNALSAMVVAGGGPPGSGLGSGLTKAVAGSQWLADRGSGAGAAAAGGGEPLSSSTARQRAAQAYQEGRRRAGGAGGGRPAAGGGGSPRSQGGGS